MVTEDQAEHDRHSALGENHWFTCGLCDDEAEPDEDRAYEIAKDQAAEDSLLETGSVDNWRSYL